MPQIIKEVMKSGRMNLKRGIPADLMATNSKVSPRLPNVMIDESRTAKGSASGTSVALTYRIKVPIVNMSRPFPTISSIYSQKNCRTNTNNVMKKVAINGPINAPMMSLSSFLITIQKYVLATMLIAQRLKQM